MKGKLIKLFLIFAVLLNMAVMPAVLMAIDNIKTIETKWSPRDYFAENSLTTSTHSITTNAAFSWLVYARGGEATFSIHHTTSTDRYGNDYQIEGATFHMFSGQFMGGKFEALTKDPKLVIHSLAAGATVQVTMTYGVRP